MWRAISLADICDIGVGNSYYVRPDALRDRRPGAAEVGRAHQGHLCRPSRARGTHVNPTSGAAVAKYAPNRENARQLPNFWSPPRRRRSTPSKNFEYPVLAGAEIDPIIQASETRKIDLARRCTRSGGNRKEASEPGRQGSASTKMSGGPLDGDLLPGSDCAAIESGASPAAAFASCAAGLRYRGPWRPIAEHRRLRCAAPATSGRTQSPTCAAPSRCAPPRCFSPASARWGR